MSEDIKQMYQKAGMKPPKGRGVHKKKFHRCVTKVAAGAKKRGKKVNPFAVCMSTLGAEKAVKASHRRSESMEDKMFNAIVDGLVEMDLAELGEKYGLEIDAAVIKAVAAYHSEDALQYKADGKEEAYAASIEDLEELLADEVVGADEELTQFVQSMIDQAQAESTEEPEDDELDVDNDE